MTRPPHRIFGTGKQPALYCVETWVAEKGSTLAKPHWRLLDCFVDREDAQARLEALTSARGVKARITEG